MVRFAWGLRVSSLRNLEIHFGRERGTRERESWRQRTTHLERETPQELKIKTGSRSKWRTFFKSFYFFFSFSIFPYCW
jgi:hypothetical protein